MPKFKAVLTYGLVVVLLISLSGCGMIFDQAHEAETEEIISETGLPEWLQLAHRSNRDLLAEEDEMVLPKDTEEDEEDEEEPAEPAPAPETAAPAPAEQSSQPAPASTPPETATSDEDEEEENGSLTRSQEMLAESWKQRQESSRDDKADDKDDKDDDDWWNQSRESFTHDMWER